MRRTVKIALSNGAAILNEIRPVDVMQAITSITLEKIDLNESVENEEWSKALFSSDLLLLPERLSEADNLLINSLFNSLNSAYFGRSSTSKNQAVLIHHGHINCWLYGWQFYLAVLDLYKEK